jgi:hypothetical protein
LRRRISVHLARRRKRAHESSSCVSPDVRAVRRHRDKGHGCASEIVPKPN